MESMVLYLREKTSQKLIFIFQTDFKLNTLLYHPIWLWYSYPIRPITFDFPNFAKASKCI